jgi:hypothetical protein
MGREAIRNSPRAPVGRGWFARNLSGGRERSEGKRFLMSGIVLPPPLTTSPRCTSPFGYDGRVDE